MKPTLSIITPSFNQGRFIERTIKSVLSQKVDELEYIVIDGGSTDNTIDILRNYDDHIHWVSERDNGQADGVNKGLKKATGEIIGWLNSDDIYYDGALSAAQDFFSNHPDIEAIYGDADHIDATDDTIEPYYTEDWNYDRLKEVCFMCQPAVFFRRRLTEKYGLLDDRLRYCMDYEYWLRIGKLTPFVRLRKKLAGSRMYNENKTLGSRVFVHQEINNMFKNKFGLVPAKWIFSYAHAVVEKMGHNRAIKSENIRFVLLLIAVSLISFAKWKRPIEIDNLKTMAGWFLYAWK
jgi:glycosyltransferase involved in cell wall biosynthesis